MSIAPHSGIIDFGTFRAPSGTLDGVQGEVPAPLASQAGYFLSTDGWAVPGGSTFDPQNVSYLTFTGAAPTLVGGRMWYDTVTGSWNLGMGGDNITQQVGEELFVYGKASAAISDSPLQIIYQTGTVGASGVITFAPTVAGITNGDLILGVATEPIALNATGRITSFGVIHGITTNGTAYGEVWADGDTIWYNPVTGKPTNVKPVAPNIKVQVGTLIKAGNGGSGSLQVEVAHGSVLGGTDSNVQITTPTLDNLLVYNGTYWANRALAATDITSALTYTPVNKAGDTMTGPLTLATTSRSRTAWTTSGVNLIQSATTFTDTTSSGALGNVYMNLFDTQTIAATNAITSISNLYGVYFKIPVRGTNVANGGTSYAVGADSLYVLNAFNLVGSGNTCNIGSNQGGGALTLGAANATGAISMGISTVSQTVNVASGATTAVSTKTVNIGTAGVSGSTTTINIGSAVSGANSNTVMGGTLQMAAYTVATLPTAGTAGRRAYVTDALAPAFLTALVGGGAVRCPAFDNGTAWVAG